MSLPAGKGCSAALRQTLADRFRFVIQVYGCASRRLAAGGPCPPPTSSFHRNFRRNWREKAPSAGIFSDSATSLRALATSWFAHASMVSVPPDASNSMTSAHKSCRQPHGQRTLLRLHDNVPTSKRQKLNGLRLSSVRTHLDSKELVVCQ